MWNISHSRSCYVDTSNVGQMGWFVVIYLISLDAYLSTDAGFGTFLFFGLINLTFIPFIYAFYPETKGRSLEEIDIIFAKAYAQKEWYVKVADEMPKLTAAEVESEARWWGLAKDEETTRSHG
jgi:Sugar (and other) transporter